jgi:hypothetical protein
MVFGRGNNPPYPPKKRARGKSGQSMPSEGATKQILLTETLVWQPIPHMENNAEVFSLIEKGLWKVIGISFQWEQGNVVAPVSMWIYNSMIKNIE